MDKSSIDNNSMNNNNMTIPRSKDTINLLQKCLLPIQLNLNINFHKRINAIKELSNKRIGIIFEYYLLIYSSHTFKQIYCIKPYDDLQEFNNRLAKESDSDKIIQKEYGLKNFVELRNKDLIIWSYSKIFYYKLSKNINELYTIHQIIDDLNQGYNYFCSWYNIHSVNELMNGSLVSCNSTGLKYYKKENDNYIFIFQKMMLEVENMIEFEENKLFLLQREYDKGACFDYASDTYSLSIYDIKNNEIIEINQKETIKRNDSNYNEDKRINFIIKGKYLFVKYDNKFNIYNIKENMKLVQRSKNNMTKNMFYFHYEKNEYNIKLLSDYINEYFIVKDLNTDTIKIYSFKDEEISFYTVFPFQQKEIEGIIKLKNNNLIMYSEKQLKLLSKI